VYLFSLYYYGIFLEASVSDIYDRIDCHSFWAVKCNLQLIVIVCSAAQ